MTYNPSDYWNERGKIYLKNFEYDKNKAVQEDFLLNHINQFSEPFTSVLELGCGFGRITKLLLNNYNGIREYVAVDLSTHQIENAKKYLKSISTSNISLTFQVSDIKSFQSKKKYDLVLLSEVLMHILPSEIESVINKVISLSKKHIINIDWYEEEPPKKIASHNFIHEYEKLYNSIPEVSYIERIPIKRKRIFGSVNTKQSIFHVLVK